MQAQLESETTPEAKVPEVYQATAGAKKLIGGGKGDGSTRFRDLLQRAVAEAEAAGVMTGTTTTTKATGASA